MLSEQKLQANRLNAQKSTGPRTPEGKAICSQNASRHRHLADVVLLACEDRAQFLRRCRRFHRQFLPVGPVEVALVNEMIAATWRMDRVSILESRILDHSYITTPAPILPDPSPDRPDHSPVAFRNALAFRELTDNSRVLPHLAREAARHRRDFHKALSTLESRRALQPAPEPESTASPAPQPDAPPDFPSTDFPSTNDPSDPYHLGTYDRPVFPPPASPAPTAADYELLALFGSVSTPPVAAPTPATPSESTTSTEAEPGLEESADTQPCPPVLSVVGQPILAAAAFPDCHNPLLGASACPNTQHIVPNTDPPNVAPVPHTDLIKTQVPGRPGHRS